MKKGYILIIASLILVILFAACSSNLSSSDETTTINLSAETTTEEAKEANETINLSADFFSASLKFLKNPEDEDLAAQVIKYTKELKEQIYNNVPKVYQNFDYFEDNPPKVVETYYVNCWIHNYEFGGFVGAVIINDNKPTYNYEHNGTLLAASVLSQNYPDNITLAKARISAYVLTQMNRQEIENCIIQNNNGEKFYYDFDIEKNNAFANIAKEILSK